MKLKYACGALMCSLVSSVTFLLGLVSIFCTTNPKTTGEIFTIIFFFVSFISLLGLIIFLAFYLEDLIISLNKDVLKNIPKQ